jgi:hypothetical protein
MRASGLWQQPALMSIAAIWKTWKASQRKPQEHASQKPSIDYMAQLAPLVRQIRKHFVSFELRTKSC